MFEEVVDSGYAENMEIYKKLKREWADKGCKLVRVKTDTKGLIMYIVLKEVQDEKA